MKRVLLLASAAVAAILSQGLPAGAAQIGAAAHEPSAPAVEGVYAPKAKPPPLPGEATSGRQAGNVGPKAAQFFYAQASQSATTGGAYGVFDVARPELSTADAHSLAELAVSSADGKQIVEVGWTVDRAVNPGSAEPHLFVFHWVDGKPTCYNGCGFVPRAGGGGPAGRRLSPGDRPYFTIRHSAGPPGAWWISADGVGWLGYFPDTLWGGRFTQAGRNQWFGEVAANSASPCTDMGNGRFSSAGNATLIYGIGLLDSTTAPNIAVGNTHPALYTATRVNGTTMRHGGPGSGVCRQRAK